MGRNANTIGTADGLRKPLNRFSTKSKEPMRTDSGERQDKVGGMAAAARREVADVIPDDFVESIPHRELDPLHRELKPVLGRHRTGIRQTERGRDRSLFARPARLRLCADNESGLDIRIDQAIHPRASSFHRLQVLYRPVHHTYQAPHDGTPRRFG